MASKRRLPKITSARPIKRIRAISLAGRHLDRLRSVSVSVDERSGHPSRVLHASATFAVITDPIRHNVRGSKTLSSSVDTTPIALESAGAEDVAVLKEPTGSALLPLTIAFVACPYFVFGGRVYNDPVLRSPDLLRNQVARALDDIYNGGPHPLNHPEVAENTRILQIVDTDLADVAPEDSPEFAVLCRVSGQGGTARIEASRRRVATYCQQYGIHPDCSVIFSAAPSSIPTGWFGTDALSRGGEPFVLNQKSGLHAYHSELPGVVAVSRRPLRRHEMRHELLHGLSSYNNGQILDEYDATPPYADNEFGGQYGYAVNKRIVQSSDEYEGIHAVYNDEEFAGQMLSMGGLRISVAKPLPGTVCLMRTLSGRPAPDSLILRFMIDRLLARIRREI